MTADERPTYNEVELETAMALWEAVIDIDSGRLAAPWAAFREGNGTAAFRSVVAGFVKACEADWTLLEGAYGMSFDWDFCPRWLLDRVDWSGPHPTVKRDTAERLAWLKERLTD